jgi:hypothetical protein
MYGSDIVRTWVVRYKSYKISCSDEMDASAVRFVPHTVAHPHTNL